VDGGNAGVALRVPYYLVPQAVSDVSTKVAKIGQLRQTGSATATTTNPHGATGNADWYAWGISDNKDKKLASNDVRAVGVQTFPADGVLAFAVATYHRWSNAAMNEFDVFVDVNNDGEWDYDVVAADLGALTTGTFSGQVAVAVFPRNGAGSIEFLADAPTDSSTLVMPVLFDQLCVAGNPCLAGKLTYWIQSFGITDGTTDVVAATAAFDPINPTISTGMFDVVSPGGSATETVSITDRFAEVPSRGFMIVTHDNRSNDEAQLVDIPGR
jgi:hypothetical protein